MAYSPVTEYTEDVAAVADPKGPMSMGVAASNPGLSAVDDGDNVAFRVTLNGVQYVIDNEVFSVLDNYLPGIGITTGDTSDAAVAAGAAGSLSAKLRSISRDMVSNIVLAAGTNNIGDIDVLTVPADPFGANADAIVAAGAAGSISAKLRRISQGLEDLKTGIVLATSTGTQEVVGDTAFDTSTGGNPVMMGVKSSSAIPSAVGADNRTNYLWGNRNGAPIVSQVPHVGLNSDPWNLVHKGVQYTSTQTSTVLQAGAAGEKIVVTKIQIQAFGTTAFDLQVYFGTGAFSRGTSRTIFDGTFKPSSTLAPGVVMDGPFIAGAVGDDIMVTTSAAGSVTISIWYYVIT